VAALWSFKSRNSEHIGKTKFHRRGRLHRVVCGIVVRALERIPEHFVSFSTRAFGLFACGFTVARIGVCRRKRILDQQSCDKFFVLEDMDNGNQSVRNHGRRRIDGKINVFFGKEMFREKECSRKRISEMTD
jgi:hypothetical protein